MSASKYNPDQSKSGAILRDFCENTSVHGLSTVLHTKSKWLKLTWLLVVTGAFVGLCFHIYWILIHFLEYKTVIYNTQELGYHFPDVAICNQNGISISNLRAAAAERSQNVQCLIDTIMANTTQKTDKSHCFLEEMPQMAVIHFGLGEALSKQIGHTLHDTIFSCSFDGQLCDDKDFELFHFPKYLNCYMFKQRRNNLTTAEGGISGLSLILFSETSDDEASYLSNGNDDDAAEGFQVAVIPPKTLPVMDLLGRHVPLGVSVTLTFTIDEYRSLSEPYHNCTLEELKSERVFSFIECTNNCLHQKVIEKCGCFPTAGIVRVNYSELSTPSCAAELFENSTHAARELTCEDKVLLNIKKDTSCVCQKVCNGLVYPTTAVESNWPTKRFADKFVKSIATRNESNKNSKAHQQYKSFNDNNTTQDEINNWIRHHFSKLNVQSSTRFRVVKQDVPLYTMTDLLCNIGGSLGLWMGISLVTSVEIIQLLLKLMYQSVKGLLGKTSL